MPNEDQVENRCESSISSSGEVCHKKRLAPVLTITLPSTEELRTYDVKSDALSITPKSTKPPLSPQLEEKFPKCFIKQRALEDVPSKDHYKKQVNLFL